MNKQLPTAVAAIITTVSAPLLLALPRVVDGKLKIQDLTNSAL